MSAGEGGNEEGGVNDEELVTSRRVACEQEAIEEGGKRLNKKGVTYLSVARGTE